MAAICLSINVLIIDEMWNDTECKMISGLILDLHPANSRLCYKVTYSGIVAKLESALDLVQH